MPGETLRPGEFPVKGVAINVASVALFATPIAVYLAKDRAYAAWRIVGADLVLLLTIFLVPPWGWKKPHPYSDQPHLRRDDNLLLTVGFVAMLATAAIAAAQFATS